MEEYPVMALVGRPNVGKSALFNALVGRQIAIVHDQPGVTRDRIEGLCKLGRHPIRVLDTGGIGGESTDPFAEDVDAQVDLAMDAAQLIVLVVDGQQGLTSVDASLARRIRRSGLPAVLVVNKIDHPNHEAAVAEFSRLGFSPTHMTSAAHGKGIHNLADVALEHLPNVEDPNPDGQDLALRVAIVGRPNVGKSSLLNALVGQARTLVSETAGTTRDAVDVRAEREGQDYIFIDTAGLRHRSRHNTSVEVFSAMRSEKSVRRADLCLLTIDSTAGVTQQDKQIARMIVEAHKPCIMVVTKWDLKRPERRPQEAMRELAEEMHQALFFVPYAPVVVVSSIEKEYTGRVFKEITRVQRAARKKISTGKLNRVLQEALSRTPPPSKSNARLKLLYATSLPAPENYRLPVPTFVLMVNSPDLMPDDYRRYLESCIRKEERFSGLPLVFRLKGRNKDGRHKD
ncbi:MAG: ribosome biogenesis GTPase Der [Verrucomicrobiales bacterium]